MKSFYTKHSQFSFTSNSAVQIATSNFSDDERQVEQILTSVLNELSKAYLNQSKQITRKVSHNKNIKKIDKKKCKVKVLFKEYKCFFDVICRKLSLDYGRQYNPFGYSTSCFMNSVYLLINAEPVSGSYGSKYARGQGPVQ